MPKRPHAAAKNERQISKACRWLAQQPTDKQNISEAARIFNVKYNTLRNRFKGFHQPANTAHPQRQLLSPSSELALVDWIIFYSITSQPKCKRTIRAMVRHMCGKRPGKNWVYSFLERHHTTIKLGKTSGLDPKRAQAFNRPVVRRFFEKVEGITKEYDIPLENMYNSDEKGAQRGGGKRGTSRKYFISRQQRTAYKAKSANLELVTIIECVSADGSALPPGFIFAGKEFCEDWFQPPGVGR
jgi:hypothetical protein